MGEREQDLRRLAGACTGRTDVFDAWVAKSFTDMLLVLEVPAGDTLPDGLVVELEERGLVGYNEVHDVSVPDPAAAGDLRGRDRYRFVDVDSRGTHQSYVVE